MNLCDIGTIKDIMAAYGLSFRKEFGQNFLIDGETVARIADSCLCEGTKTVLEIGAGFGALTSELARRFEKVIALEIDRGLIPLLGFTLSGFSNIEIIQADVTKTDLRELLSTDLARGGVSVCANLPYYITTPILLQLLETRLPFDCVCLMVQDEVADRLCAAPGDPEYGSVTAYMNYFGTCTRLFGVPKNRFYPAPKVDSAVIRIDLYKEKPAVPADEQLFFRVIRAAFGQRRKTLPNALSSQFTDISKTELAGAVESCGFSPDIRGERLSCADFVRLSDEIGRRMKNV